MKYDNPNINQNENVTENNGIGILTKILAWFFYICIQTIEPYKSKDLVHSISI